MPRSSAHMFEILHALVGDDLACANRFIQEHLDSQVEMIPRLGSHLISSGGKRLRPIIALLAARMYGYRGDQHALLAAVVEFIHTATLLHDDVVDSSNTRRGRATANSVWGDKAPVLVGDFLFSRSFQILVNYGDLRVLRIIADACAVISEGEVLQLVASNDLGATEAHYLDVVTRKTATLFAAAAQIGAVVNHQPEEEVERMGRYGLLLGQAYQLVDDALDYVADQEVLGKTVGDDFQEGKVTLPLIHAFRNGSDEEKSFWTRCVEERDHPEGSLQEAIRIIRERGSVAYSMEKAKEFAFRAKIELEGLPKSPERDALIMIADFSVDRDY